MTELTKKTLSDMLRPLPRIFRVIAIVAVSLCSAVVTFGLLASLFTSPGMLKTSQYTASADLGMIDRYDRNMTNAISTALDGILSIEKVYWLSDEDLVAPTPNPACFGSTSDPSSLQWLLDTAAPLLKGQETMFHTGIQLLEGSEVRYYLDDTILVIVWQEVRNRAIYTISEVKLAHASQFRRFLADGQYGSNRQYTTTEMSASVNAIMASSGDYYKYRQIGAVVYNGVVQRFDSSKRMDTCFVDDKGDLILSYKGEFQDADSLQAYVDANNIRFSLAFGPILIDNGVRCEMYNWYDVGEAADHLPRAALCQDGDLHYYVIAVNCAKSYWNFPTLDEFGNELMVMGIDKAYTLDGGQTATISMNHVQINPNQYDAQREISDIIYFATALPDGG